MPINISSKIKNEIIDNDVRANIETLLITKSANKCFLCQQTIDSVKDNIEADHDIPRIQGGLSNYDNLNLVHESCNKFKRDHESLQIKQFLPLRQFLIHNPNANYGVLCTDFLKITQQNITIEWENDKITLKDGTATFGTFMSHRELIKRPQKEIYYIFTKLPLRLIHNDNVQPRSIKSNHVFNLFQDSIPSL